MPFTFSHPAVILPFKTVSGNKVSLTAMAIGSMAPDFEFFFRMSAQTDISHTLKGIFLFNIPVVVLMAFLFQCWVKNPFIDHLPAFLQKRFSIYKRFDWVAYFKENWVVVVTSAFLGVVLHLLCDDFTHHYGWTAKNIQILARLYPLMGREIPGYHLLQYVSSLLLGLVLLIDAWELPPVHPVKQQSNYARYWGIVLLVSVPAFVLRYTMRGHELSMNDIIMTIIAAGLLGVLAASTAAHTWNSSSSARVL